MRSAEYGKILMYEKIVNNVPIPKHNYPWAFSFKNIATGTEKLIMLKTIFQN